MGIFLSSPGLGSVMKESTKLEGPGGCCVKQAGQERTLRGGTTSRIPHLNPTRDPKRQVSLSRFMDKKTRTQEVKYVA